MMSLRSGRRMRCAAAVASAISAMPITLPAFVEAKTKQCGVGDRRYAHFPGDDEAQLRQVTIKRQNEDTCEFWLQWEHDAFICMNGETPYWGSAGTEKYCSYIPHLIHEFAFRSSAQCASLCTPKEDRGMGAKGSSKRDQHY